MTRSRHQTAVDCLYGKGRIALAYPGSLLGMQTWSLWGGNMQVGIAVDNTVPLYLPAFIEFFRAHAPSIQCHVLDLNLKLSPMEIDFEREFAKLDAKTSERLAKNDISLLVTTIPFENNFFYLGNDILTILSLSGWHQLTPLPMSNGIAYMLCQLILRYRLHIGEVHEDRTGCINDFLWDKTGIDVCMRAAFICDICRKNSKEDPRFKSREFEDLVSLLNVISTASRRSTDILTEISFRPNGSIAPSSRPSAVFLCHNAQDKPLVRILNEALQNGDVVTWFDEQRIKLGEVWQDKLEAAISSVAACLVVVGDSGLGPWQNLEQRAFINEFANRGCKVIPVLIGNPARPPELPLFLKQFMWLDLRRDDGGRQLATLLSALRS
jgi:TIR domain